MSWRVHKNGKPLGIVESNFPWASQYWAERSRISGNIYRLVPQ